MAAAQSIMLALASARFGPIRSGPVLVVRAGVEQLITIRIKILAEHPVVMRAAHHVPEVSGNVVRDKRLSEIIPSQTPRIGGAISDHLEQMPRGMRAPDAAAP